MSTSAVLKKISSVRKFFESSSRNNSEHDPSALQKSFTDSIINKLSLLKAFGPDEGAQVMDALKQSTGSPLGEIQTKRVMEFIEKKIHDSVSSTASSDKTRPSGATGKSNQFLKHWWNYMKQSQIDYLKDPSKSFNSKLTLVAEVGMMIGCNGADEQAKKWALALLLMLHYPELPSPQHVFEKLQDLKQAWISEFKPWHGEILVTFPEYPRDLPQATYNHAYPDEPPVSVVMTGISTVADSIPLRKNLRLLKKSKTQCNEWANAEAVFDGNHRAAPLVIVKAEAKAYPDVKLEPHGLQGEAEDPEEALIKQEYESKLTALREKKAAPMQQPNTGKVQVLRSSDGSLALFKQEGSSTVKRDPSAEELLSPKEEGNMDDEHNTPSLGDLDPYTRAAVDALNSRNESRAAAAKLKKGQNKKAMKRPAGAANDNDDESPSDSTKENKKKTTSIKKRPAAVAAEPVGSKVARKHVTEPVVAKGANKRSSDEDAVVPKARIMSVMPKKAVCK